MREDKKIIDKEEESAKWENMISSFEEKEKRRAKEKDSIRKNVKKESKKNTAKVTNIINKNNDSKEISKAKKIFMIITLCLIVFITLYVREGFYDRIHGPQIEEIAIKVDNIKIAVDKERTIDVEVTPAKASKAELKWHISNPDVIEINGNIAKGKEIGKSKIYLSSGDIVSNEIELSCVTFIDEAKILNPIDKLSAFEEYKLEVEVFPEAAEDKTYIIESENSDIIEVKEDNIIYGQKEGKTKIFIKDSFGEILTEMPVEVIWNKVESIKLDESTITVAKGKKNILYADIKPANATNRNLEWSSENEEVAKVENGIIEGINIGRTNIKVKVMHEDMEATCSVVVIENETEGEIKYITGEYDLKAGPLHQTDTIRKARFWEKFEKINELPDKWVKVRDSEGNPFYVLNRDNRFVSEKPKLIETIEYISNEELELPAGSAITSTMMVLRYKGYSPTKERMLDLIKFGQRKTKTEDGMYTGADPNNMFVGNPAGKPEDGNYGIYAEPIKNAINWYFGRIAKNISGQKEEEIYKHIDDSNPVIIWGNRNDEEFIYGDTWKTKNKEYRELKGLTTLVLVGYDDKYIYTHNPDTGKYQKCLKEIFWDNWEKTERQAVLIGN